MDDPQKTTCPMCLGTRITDGALGYNGQGPCPKCADEPKTPTPRTSDLERRIEEWSNSEEPDFEKHFAAAPSPSPIELARQLERELTSALAENERLKASMVQHFTDEHLAGDGPEIDRWKRQNATLRARVKELEEQLEPHAWSVSPAMAQAKIDQLNARVSGLESGLDAIMRLAAMDDDPNILLAKAYKTARQAIDEAREKGK